MSTFAEQSIICFSLMKSCIGAGIYAYPHAFNVYGVVWTVILTVISCAASIFGTYMYIDRNKEYSKENTISTLGATIISSKFKTFIDLVVILKCLIVGAGYLNLANEIIQMILPSINIFEYVITPNILAYIFTGLGCLLILPGILGTKLGKLKNMSYIGTFSILALIILSKIETSNMPVNYQMLVNEPPSVIENIGLFVFGFSCHQSILTIHNESNLSERRLKWLILLSFICVSGLYLLFGFINYSAFSIINNNPVSLKKIFSLWGKDHITTKIAIFIFSLSLIITVPFQIHPAKSYFFNIFNMKDNKLVGISMIVLCYFLTTQSWYDFYFVSSFAAKPLNSFLCFGFPALFTVFNQSKKSYSDFFVCGFLALFSLACLSSYAMWLYGLIFH